MNIENKFEIFCDFVKKQYENESKIKICVAGYINYSGQVFEYAQNSYCCCAERNLICGNVPHVYCDMIVIRMHKNSHGLFIKNCQPCGKCVEYIAELPENIEHIIWSKNSGFTFETTQNIPPNTYVAHNGSWNNYPRK